MATYCTYHLNILFKSSFHELTIMSGDQEEFEDTKGVIRIRKSKKNRQHNDQKKKDKKDKQRSAKPTHETKNRVTRIPLKTGCELRCSGISMS